MTLRSFVLNSWLRPFPLSRIQMEIYDASLALFVPCRQESAYRQVVKIKVWTTQRNSLSSNILDLVPYESCNKLLQIKWLRTAQMYGLTVCISEVQSGSHWTKIKGLAKCIFFLLETLGESAFLPYQLPETILIPPTSKPTTLGPVFLTLSSLWLSFVFLCSFWGL